jgi:hypothetical protein
MIKMKTNKQQLVILILLIIPSMLMIVTTTQIQNANAVITMKENCRHSGEQCMAKDLRDTFGNIIRGLTDDSK